MPGAGHGCFFYAQIGQREMGFLPLERDIAPEVFF